MPGASEQPGERIGPYELVSLLGRGGSGAVWKALRREPFTQQVAIKIVKPGMDSEAVLARFAQERQTLARMEHPGIARVVDGGLTPRGRPYFVMELVEGSPITAWCDERRLPLRDRVALLAEACDAVQHAHAKGVIHRDLKPSNILVAEVDGTPRAKVIDFGIAKAIVGEGEPGSTLTELGQTLGTPEYMSPEQADPDGGDVDTRSDVYGLGATLYELLCGHAPFGGGPGTTTARVVVLKAVRGEVPPRPSLRAAGDPAAAERRGTTAADLAGTLARDLDWVPMKALRKDADARYPAASDLAADLRAWLDGRPIEAAPESVAYHVRIFVRRNRLAVGAAAVVAASLVAATAVSIRYALAERDARVAADAASAEAIDRAAEATRARADAMVREAEAMQAKADSLAREAETRRVAEYQSEVLGRLDPAWIGAAIRQDVTNRHAAAVRRIEPNRQVARERVMAFFNDLMLVNRTDLGVEVLDRWILDPMSKDVAERFADLPLAAAAIRHALAESRWGVRQLEDARREIDLALATRRELLGETDVETNRSLAVSAMVAASAGDLDRAIAEATQALDGLRRGLGPDSDAALRLQTFLGEYLVERGEPAVAIPLLQETLEATRRIYGESDARTGTRRSALAAALIELGRLEEAEPHAREGLRIRVATLGPDAKYTIRAQVTVGDWLRAAGRLEEAGTTYDDALARSIRTEGSDQPQTVELRLRIGDLALERGRIDEAIVAFREALDSARRSVGAGHPLSATSAAHLGWALASSDPATAMALIDETLAIVASTLGTNHPATLRLAGVRAWLRSDEAPAEFATVLEAAREALPDRNPARLWLGRLDESASSPSAANAEASDRR